MSEGNNSMNGAEKHRFFELLRSLLELIEENVTNDGAYLQSCEMTKEMQDIVNNFRDRVELIVQEVERSNLYNHLRRASNRYTRSMTQVKPKKDSESVICPKCGRVVTKLQLKTHFTNNICKEIQNEKNISALTGKKEVTHIGVEWAVTKISSIYKRNKTKRIVKDSLNWERDWNASQEGVRDGIVNTNNEWQNKAVEQQKSQEDERRRLVREARADGRSRQSPAGNELIIDDEID